MDYKKIITSRNVRAKILACLDWVPDRVMIPLQYWIHTGRRLDMKNPRRFTEKLQLYKLMYRNPEMLRCTDKYTVREFVAEKGLADILIPLIGVYDSPGDIDFESLPDSFVAKTSDGGGGNQVLICRDKAALGKQAFFERIGCWMAQPKPKKQAGREWAYENGLPRRIIIEALISDNEHDDLPDYKFYCFDGEPRYCQVIGNRHTCETIDFFDMNWQHMPFCGLNPACGPAEKPIVRPVHFEAMKTVARKLSADFPFSRIDLYTTGESTFFGEITFYPASGYGNFTPDEWDCRLGQLIDLQFVKWGGASVDVSRRIDLTPARQQLIDYKFFCFGGKVEFVYGVSDRNVGETAEIGIYDKDFNKLSVARKDERAQTTALPRPRNYEAMIAVAEKLSCGFPEVRVDLYNIGGKIYFGELTFYDGSGYMGFDPDSFDFEAGAMFDVASFMK